MNRWTLLALSAFVALSAAAAPNDPSFTTQIAVKNVASFRADTWSTYPRIHLSSYSNTNGVPDGGEGDFVYGACGGAVDDGGVVLQDRSGNCYFRQFSGAVHATWYGVADATTSACLSNRVSCDSKATIDKAFLAAKAYGNGVVDTVGRSIVLNSQLTVPDGQTLTCSVFPGGNRRQLSSDAVPYYTLGGALVTNTGVLLGNASNLDKCFGLPEWYTPTLLATIGAGTQAQGTRALVDLTHNYVNTFVYCTGEACHLTDLTAIGFDVCFRSDLSPRGYAHNLYGDCNIVYYMGTNGGGEKIDTIVAQNIITNEMIPNPGDGVNYKETDWPITNWQNAAGLSKFTLSTAIQSNTLVAGDVVLVGGLGVKAKVDTTGDIASGSNMVQNIPASSGDSDGAEDIQVGYTATDTVTPGCIPGSTTVTDIDQDSGIATLSANASCTVTAEGLRFVGNSTGPSALNGECLVSAVSGADITCQGLAYAGSITFTTETWQSGSQAMLVPDTSNVGYEQYVCKTSTGPFCTPPDGYARSTVSTTDSATLGSSSALGDIAVTGSLTGWSSKCGSSPCILKVDSEIMTYKITNAIAPTLTILARGQNGTTAATHSCGGGCTVTGQVPSVLSVDAIDNVVFLSTAAQSTCASVCGNVTFTNDTALNVGGFIGTVALTATYHWWTATTDAKSDPAGQFTTTGSGTSGTTSLTLASNLVNALKVQPGMRLRDITNPADLQAGTHVVSLAGNVVTLDKTISTTISGDTIVVDQCGFPTNNHYWEGSCVAAMLLATGQQRQGKGGAAGLDCATIRAHGWKIYIHTLSGNQTTCVNPVFDSGGGSGASQDPRAWGILFEGNANRMEFTGGKISAYNVFGNTPSKQKDGVSFVGTNFGPAPNGMAFVNGANGNLVLSAVHGNATATYGYSDSAASQLVFNASNIANFTMLTKSPVDFKNIVLSGNVLSTSCAPSMGVTIYLSSCGGVPDWQTDALAALTNAETNALAANVHTITLDCNAAVGCGYLLGSAHTVPTGIQLVCQGPVPVQPVNNDYRTFPNGLVTATGGLTFNGSGIRRCAILNGGSGKIAHKAPPASLRDNLLRMTSYSGTGVSCVGDLACSLEDLLIVGFGTCVDTTGSRSGYASNIAMDCTTGFKMRKQGSGQWFINNPIAAPFGTRGITGISQAFIEPAFPVTIGTDGAGHLLASLVSACSDVNNCPQAGDTLSIINSATYPSADGEWVAGTTVLGATPTVVLTGSTDTIRAGTATLTGTITNGSTEVTGLTGGTLAGVLTQVWPGEAVTGANIPGGDKIAAISKNLGILWLTAAATGTATETLTFADAATALSVSVATIVSGGTGYGIGDILAMDLNGGTYGTCGSGGATCPAQVTVTQIDNGLIGGSGVITAVSITDGGVYTVLPGNPDTVTGGNGTGATFNLSSAAQLVISANNRTGAAYDIASINNAKFVNPISLNYKTGFLVGTKTSGLAVFNAKIDCNNYLENDVKGLWFTDNAKQSTFIGGVVQCWQYAVLSQTIAGSNISPNLISGMFIGSPAQHAGFQSTILSAESGTFGTGNKAPIIFEHNFSYTQNSAIILGKDVDSITVDNNVFKPTTVYYETSGTNAKCSNNRFLTATCQDSSADQLTVANLPTCNATTAPVRRAVSDATTSLTVGIGAVVVGGGANKDPVYCDGTNWRIGMIFDFQKYLHRAFANDNEEFKYG